MTQETVLQLIDRFEAGSMTRLEYRDGAARLVLEKNAGAGPTMVRPASAVKTTGAADTFPAGSPRRWSAAFTGPPIPRAPPLYSPAKR